MYFDSHAHVNDTAFAPDRAAVLERAKAAGVDAIIDVGYDRPSIERSKTVGESFPHVYSAFGFHPHEARQVTAADMPYLMEQLAHPRCVALGEIGLDTVKTYSPLEVQRSVLALQLEQAAGIGKPVIFHSRGAEKEVLQTAKRFGVQRAVFHCYTGDADTAENILAAGYSLSLAGFVTYVKSKPAWLDRESLKKVFIETDCPYLAPVPYRGKRNEPSFMPYTCKKIAGWLVMPFEEVAQQTTQNAKEFFGLAAF